MRAVASLRRLVVLLTALGLQAAWARYTRSRVPPPPRGVRPRENRRVTTTDGTRLHVEVDGPESSETTVVLVHGVLARSAEWDAQFDALRRTVRVVRYDHRGHGESDAVRGPVDIDLLAGDLAEVLDSVVPRGRIVLAGHSMGGMVVLALATHRPQMLGPRVVGVVLVGSGAGHHVARHPVENAVRWAARRRLLSPLLWGLRVAAPLLELLRPRDTRTMRRVVRALVFGADDATPDLVLQTQRMLEQPPLRTIASIQGSLLRHDALDAMPLLRGLPVTVVAGADDRLTRVAHSYAMARDLGPRVELRVLPGVGHAVVQSRAVEVTAAIEDTVRVATEGASPAA